MSSPSAVPVPTGGSSSSTGLIVGIVIGVIAFLALKAGIIYYWCHRRQKKAKLLTKPLPLSQNSKSTDILLQQLREQEFDCHNIEICVDSKCREIELGSGGFGRVIKGVRDGVQPVAIKMMFRSDAKAREEFMKEIKLLKQLSRDTNVVQYFGASFQEDQLWLVTEYMAGGDLRKALSNNTENCITWWDGGKQIALDAARGLAFLHSQSVIHRDIKSHNILLTGEGRAKIADVGMAHLMSADEYASSISQQGTFNWAAPELILQQGPLTTKMDIYSYGVCLWEIVTSQMPKRRQMHPPSEEDCPPGVTKIIQDCMRRNPDDRPSALEIYRRLQACEPFSEDGGQYILDSAEAGGRNSPRSLVTGRHGKRAFYKFEPTAESGRGHSIKYDSPMSTHDCFKGASSSAHDKLKQSSYHNSPLPTSNEAFAQLVASFSQGQTSTPALTSYPGEADIMASSSVDADLSQIPSVNDRVSLPEYVLTVNDSNDSRYLDFTQSHSSEDMCGMGTGLASICLSTLPTINRSYSSDEVFLDRPAEPAFAESAATESEDNDTIAVAVASVQGYAGSSQANSQLNTGSHNSEAGSIGAADEPTLGKPLDEASGAGVAPDLEDVPIAAAFHGLPAAGVQQVYPFRPGSLHTGNSSLHTGSTTAYEDADEHPAWYKP